MCKFFQVGPLVICRDGKSEGRGIRGGGKQREGCGRWPPLPLPMLGVYLAVRLENYTCDEADRMLFQKLLLLLGPRLSLSLSLSLSFFFCG